MTTAADTLVGTLPMSTQRMLVSQIQDSWRRSPPVQARTPGGAPMSVRVSSVGRWGWVGDGEYRYDPVDSRGRAWPELPSLWSDIATQYAGHHPWDCAIINWYGPDAKLGWHQDKHEACLDLPIVTISLGDAASWAVRETLETPISRVRIDSGSVTRLAGPTRMWWHTIERIQPAPLFSPLPKRGRVSITVRVAGEPEQRTPG